MTDVQKRAAWAKYVRSFETASQRPNPRSETNPESVSLKIVSLAEKKAWFPVWFCKDCSWGKVIVTEEFQQLVMNSTELSHQWLTEGQLIDLYKSETVAKAITAVKRTTKGHWRPHPEIPTVTEAMQFLCQLNERQVEMVQKRHANKVSATGQVDGAGAEHLLNHMSDICNPQLPHHTPPAVADAAPAARGEGGGSVGGGEPQGQGQENLKTKAELQLEKKQAAMQDRLLQSQRRQAERQQNKQAEKDKAKAEREKWKESVPGKAQEWLDNLNSDLSKISDAKADIKLMRENGMSDHIAEGWVASFKEHMKTMKNLRVDMEQIRDNTITGKEEDLSNARDIVLALKRDLKGLKSCKAQYIKNSDRTTGATVENL